MYLLVLVMCLLPPVSCAAPIPGPIYDDPQGTVRTNIVGTNIGEQFTIGLHVVLRLGARWQVSYDEEMLTLISEEYLDDDAKEPGLGGTQYFQFKALKADNTQIEFSLKRGTTGPVSEQKTFSIQIEGG